MKWGYGRKTVDDADLYPGCADAEVSPERALDYTQDAQEVVPGLLLGPAAACGSPGALRSLGVDRVLCLRLEPPPDYGGFLEPGAALHVPVPDNNREAFGPERLAEARKFIARSLAAGHRVVVHCASGVSRSPAVVMAFLVCEWGMSLREAYETVLRARPVVRPNDAFFRELCQLESARRPGMPPSVSEEDRFAFALVPLFRGKRSLEEARRALAAVASTRNKEELLPTAFSLLCSYRQVSHMHYGYS
eukprot:m51a1_g4788 putative mitogen-activated protein kinase phosphatase (248) ;mRNA; f:65632-67689